MREGKRGRKVGQQGEGGIEGGRELEREEEVRRKEKREGGMGE